MWSEETRKRLEEICKQRADPAICEPDEYDRDIGCIAAALDELDRRDEEIKRLCKMVAESDSRRLEAVFGLDASKSEAQEG